MDVCFGSKADIAECETNVRFTPESGHLQCKPSCLLWAISGHLGHAEMKTHAGGCVRITTLGADA